MALIDSGLTPTLSDFAGRIDTTYSGDVTGAGRALADQGGHGTAVAAVAVAARDGQWMHGVAFDATIVALRADTPGSCSTVGTDGGCAFDDSAIAAGIDRAVQSGARVINLSLNGTAPGVDLKNAMQRAVNAGIVFVISAGDDGGTADGNTANAFAASPASLFPGMVIVAGSLGTFNEATLTTSATTTISPFSNRAGSAANSALFAVGAGVRSIDETGGQFYFSGTSFSAPTITGAVALMAQLFPNLTGAQIVDLLLRTADDLGSSGTDSIYGRGGLNITRAVQPVGQMALAGTKTVVSGISTAPAASGDAVATNGSLGAVLLDSYDRAYAIDLARTVQVAQSTRPLERALSGGNLRAGAASAGPVSVTMTVAQAPDRSGFTATSATIGLGDARRARLLAGSMIARLDARTQVAIGFADGAKSLERQLDRAQAGAFLVANDVAGDPGFSARRGASLALRRKLGAFGLTLSGENGNVTSPLAERSAPSPFRWSSVALDRRFGRNFVSFGVGRLDEKATLLGGRMSGMVGGGGAQSTFFDLDARHDFGSGLTLGINARRGWTDFAGGAFASGAYGVDVGKAGLLSAGDRIGLRIAQPLRIEHGGFALLLPTAYNYDTASATTTLERFSLAPKGREIDGELSYQSPVIRGSGWLGGNLFVRRQPGHFASAAPDVGGAIRFSLGF